MVDFEDYEKGRRDSRRPSRNGPRRDSGRRPPRRDFRPRDQDNQIAHTVICDSCGESCEVPFKPTAGKPVYCDNCFKKNKGSISDNRSPASTKSLEDINEKLDKILALLKKE